MSEPKKISTFLHCRCPHCKAALDAVSTSTTECPCCRRSFEARQVWLTRRDPGTFVLPGWAKMFGFPLLLIALGIGLGALRLIDHINIPTKLIILIVGSGLAWAIIIMITGGEEL